ncbi:MAG: universal stress protein [Vulcanimicrobiota bacterium]
MINKILVPLDGSKLSERIFPLLRLLAPGCSPSLEIDLVRCYEPPGLYYPFPEVANLLNDVLTDDVQLKVATEYLEQKKAELSEFKVNTRVLSGKPSVEILEAGAEADLILMASLGHGGLGRWLLGSTTVKVTRGATVPVLVVGAKTLEIETPSKTAIKRIVVGLDGSEPAEQALLQAADLARNLGAELYLYQAVSRLSFYSEEFPQILERELEIAEEYLKALARELGDLSVSVLVRDVGDSLEIAEYAEEVEADLLVLGSHGKGGVARWVLGSQTEIALQEASCPVLITR